MPQVTERLVAKSMFKGRMVLLLQLVHVGIQGYVFEPGKIVPELPGIDFFGSINHLCTCCRR